MKNLLLTTFLMLSISSISKAQFSYTGKIEFGYMHFEYHPIQVDPGPDWKGYNLSDNGICINAINGLSNPNKKLFAGLGLGYLNFRGNSGVSVFADFEYLPLKTRITPLLNFKIGYNHIWNQYDGGTGTTLAEFGVGMNLKLSEEFGLFLKSGILFTQQSALLPIIIGLRF
jgi:hypothetical protein